MPRHYSHSTNLDNDAINSSISDSSRSNLYNARHDIHILDSEGFSRKIAEFKPYNPDTHNEPSARIPLALTRWCREGFTEEYFTGMVYMECRVNWSYILQYHEDFVSLSEGIINRGSDNGQSISSGASTSQDTCFTDSDKSTITFPSSMGENETTKGDNNVRHLQPEVLDLEVLDDVTFEPRHMDHLCSVLEEINLNFPSLRSDKKDAHRHMFLPHGQEQPLEIHGARIRLRGENLPWNRWDGRVTIRAPRSRQNMAEIPEAPDSSAQTFPASIAGGEQGIETILAPWHDREPVRHYTQEHPPLLPVLQDSVDAFQPRTDLPLGYNHAATHLNPVDYNLVDTLGIPSPAYVRFVNGAIHPVQESFAWHNPSATTLPTHLEMDQTVVGRNPAWIEGAFLGDTLAVETSPSSSQQMDLYLSQIWTPGISDPHTFGNQFLEHDSNLTPGSGLAMHNLPHVSEDVISLGDLNLHEEPLKTMDTMAEQNNIWEG